MNYVIDYQDADGDPFNVVILKNDHVRRLLFTTFYQTLRIKRIRIES